MHPPKHGYGWLVILGIYWVLQVVYLLSPVDLVPDFIPVFGFADDLFGLLAGVAVTGYTLVREFGPPALPEVEAYRPLSDRELEDL